MAQAFSTVLKAETPELQPTQGQPVWPPDREVWESLGVRYISAECLNSDFTRGAALVTGAKGLLL